MDGSVPAVENRGIEPSETAVGIVVPVLPAEGIVGERHGMKEN